MPTVSQHYGHHAVPGAVDETRTRQQAAPVVLMVSGGADSTALLLMACTSKLDIQDGRGVAPIARERLHVLHVNHHLRARRPMATRPLCVSSARNMVYHCAWSTLILMGSRAILRPRPARCAMPRRGGMFASSAPRRGHRERRLVSAPRTRLRIARKRF